MAADETQSGNAAKRQESLRLAAKVVYYDRDNDEAWDELGRALDAVDQIAEGGPAWEDCKVERWSVND